MAATKEEEIDEVEEMVCAKRVESGHFVPTGPCVPLSLLYLQQILEENTDQVCFIKRTLMMTRKPYTPCQKTRKNQRHLRYVI